MRAPKLTTLVGLFALWLLLVIPAQAQEPVFRIGILGAEQDSITKGARLAVNALNAAGGVQGADGTSFRLEVIVQPTDGGANLVTAATNLDQARVVAVVGPESSQETANGLRTLQDLNVTVLTPATDDTLMASDSSGRLFRSRAADLLQGRSLANFLINDLGLQRIATVQLDIESTAGVIGFSNAATGFGVQPQPFLLESGTVIADLARNLAQNNPQIAVTYGNPELAADFFNALREVGWAGMFAFNQAANEAFQQAVSAAQLNGIFAATSWSFASPDASSDAFLGDYVRTYGEIPDALAAAAYDSVQLVAAGIGRPGELPANIAQLGNIAGVQGLLTPEQLSRGETSNNVMITRLGVDGVPQIVARFAGDQRLLDVQPLPAETPTPAPTPTPEGVVLTIVSQFQNVRSGPSTDFEVIGRLEQDSQARVIGATIDLSWLVIDFRGQQGWLSRPILETSGDLNSVPIIASPPTPTPPPSPTPAPIPDIIIEAGATSPTPITPGQPFIASVTVRNNGATATGQFSVAATFPPNNVFASAFVPGLGPGQSTIVNLSSTLTNTGFYTVTIVADLNNEVAEGEGENNNANFTMNYSIDKPIIRQAQQTLNAGDTIDLEGNGIQGDANWNGNALNAIFGAKLGIIPNIDAGTVHWDLINSSIINQDSVPRLSMNAGTVIGIITADGNRGFLRVDDLPGNQMVTTFRVYQN